MLSRPANRARATAIRALDLPRDSRVNTHHSKKKAPTRQVGAPHTELGVKHAVKRNNDVHGCAKPQRRHVGRKKGHIPPNIRLRSEPMDPDNSFGHGLPLTASSRSA
jgi:hypothetical protein